MTDRLHHYAECDEYRSADLRSPERAEQVARSYDAGNACPLPHRVRSSPEPLPVGSLIDLAEPEDVAT